MILKVPLEFNDDPRLTCLVCTSDTCEYRFVIDQPTHKVWVGAHLECVVGHVEDDEKTPRGTA